MPMYRTLYRDPFRSTSIVSPSMTLTTVAVSEGCESPPPEKIGANIGMDRENKRDAVMKIITHVYHLVPRNGFFIFFELRARDATSMRHAESRRSIWLRATQPLPC